MTIDEAKIKCNSLWTLTHTLWHTSKTAERTQLIDQYRSIWREIQAAGYTISKHRHHLPTGQTVEFIPHKRRQNVELVKINMNPTGKRMGDCTTRTLAYLLKGIASYDQIRRQQDANSYRFYANRRQWNCVESYHPIFRSNGYVKFDLPSKKTRATLARLLKMIKNPIATESSSHIAVIENGKIVDTWNSGGGHVECIWAKTDDMTEIKQILKQH